MADDHPPSSPAESREPTVADLRDLCRNLNQRGARYVVIGGFAMSAAGYNRRTMDIDLLVDTSGDNESKVLDAVAQLPDGAAREIAPGEIAQWTVVRVADEIVVDLMHSACGVTYLAAAGSIEVRTIDGVPVPFASPALLWRMKKPTRREKDAADVLFLAEWFKARGIAPPPVE
ncbi:MAG: hypothetical protein AB7O66_08630 [Limisphaerales bacterium]